MDVSFLVAVSIFILFISLILVASINYFVRTPESATIFELRSKTKNLFDIFFGSGGIVTSERVTTDLYRIPLFLEETNGTSRAYETVSLYVDFDDVCDGKVSWNNSVRVYDQQFTELPSKISYQEFCSSQWLNRSIVTFVTNISANEKKRVYVYSINNSDTTAPTHVLSLKGYWLFDEASGTLTKDFSSNQNNGTLTNFDFNASSGWFNGTECRYGSCLKFDGVNDYVDVGDPASGILDPNYITLSAWINSSSIGSLQYIISKDRDCCDSPGQGGYGLSINSAGKLIGEIWKNSNNNLLSVTGDTTISANTWYNTIMVFNGTNIILYLNGKQDGVSSTSSPDLIQTTTKSLVIGALSYSVPTYYKFKGIIDDARIYNKALANEEIKSIANATLLTITSFPSETVTAISAAKVQELSGRNYQEIKSLLGGDYDFRIEIREKR